MGSLCLRLKVEHFEETEEIMSIVVVCSLKRKKKNPCVNYIDQKILKISVSWSFCSYTYTLTTHRHEL